MFSFWKFLVLWILVVPWNSILGACQGDPAEQLAFTLQSKLGRHNEELQKEVLKPLRKITEKLRAEMGVLETSGEKDKAEVLRALLQKIDSSKDPTEAVERIDLEPIPISLQVHHLIVQFLDEIRVVDKQFAERFEKMRQPILKDALRFSKQLANSNPAAANRVKLFYTQLLAIESPKFTGEVPKLPTDREYAEIVYKRSRAEFTSEVRSDIRREIHDLFAKLSDLRAELVRNKDANAIGRLDEVAIAFSKIEGPVDPMESFGKRKKADDSLDGRPQMFQVQHWIERNRKLLSAPVISILKEHHDRTNARKAKQDGLLDELDKQWASFVSKDLKAKLQERTSFATERLELSAYLRLKQKKIPDWLGGVDGVPLPDAIDEAMLLISAFDENASRRLQEADRQDAEIRQMLIVRLEALPDVQGQDAARKTLLKTLRSDYARGLRGTMLFEAKPNLSDEANDLIESYGKRSAKSIESLVGKHRQEWEKLAKALASVRKGLVNKEDFEGAVLLGAHLSKREYPIPPLPLRVFSDQRPGRGPIVYGFSRPTYIVKREGDLFWAQSNTSFPLHFSRHQMLLGWEDCADRTELDFAKEIGWAEYKQQPKDPPSRPIEEADQLEIGQEVLFCSSLTWHSGKVADLSPMDVVVSFISFTGQYQTQFVPRLGLRIVE